MESPKHFLIHYIDNNITVNGYDTVYSAKSARHQLDLIEQEGLTNNQKEKVKADFQQVCENLVNDTWYILARCTKTNECIVYKLDDCNADDRESYILFYTGYHIEVSVYLEDGGIYIRRKRSNMETYTFKAKLEVPIILLKVNEDIELLAIPTELAKTAFSDNYQEVLIRCLVKPVRFNLTNFKDFLANEDLFYSDADLINFHACIDSGYLTILAGYSGTGKSALAIAYVKYMTGDDSSRYVIIPIMPTFTEPSMLCGYYSSAKNNYKPDKNGFINLIREANKEENQNNTYYVIFDEMNVAPVENWFCEFLSIMESGDDLVLYNDTEKIKSVIEEFIEKQDINIAENLKIELKKLYEQNAQTYKSRYALKNVKFIGTMNEDESGNILSGRVLDRASIVTLQRPNIGVAIKASSKFYKLSKYQQDVIGIIEDLSKKVYETREELEASGEDCLDIEKLNISERVVNYSLRHIKSIENIDGSQDSMDEMIDRLFYGKVFSKLSVNDNSILIKKWLEVCKSCQYNLITSVARLNEIKNAQGWVG